MFSIIIIKKNFIEFIIIIIIKFCLLSFKNFSSWGCSEREVNEHEEEKKLWKPKVFKFRRGEEGGGGGVEGRGGKGACREEEWEDIKQKAWIIKLKFIKLNKKLNLINLNSIIQTYCLGGSEVFWRRR